MKCHVCDSELIDVHYNDIAYTGWCDTCSVWMVLGDINAEKSVMEEYDLQEKISDRVYNNSDICIAFRKDKLYCDIWVDDIKIHESSESSLSDASVIFNDAMDYLYKFILKKVLYENNIKSSL